jgi:hypothetical protein
MILFDESCYTHAKRLAGEVNGNERIFEEEWQAQVERLTS